MSPIIGNKKRAGAQKNFLVKQELGREVYNKINSRMGEVLVVIIDNK